MRTTCVALFGALGFPCAVAACSSSGGGDPPPPDGGNIDSGASDAVASDAAPSDAVASDAGPDAVGTGGRSSGGQASPQALVRVAHLSPGAPAIDFCVAPHGSSSFTGPVLAGVGLSGGLPYSNVTQYFPYAPAQYDVRVVAPGAASCSQPLAGLSDFTQLPALSAGAVVTLAAIGQNPVHLAAYVDQLTAPSGTTLQRFIHASPGAPAVNVGFESGSTFTPVFSDVAFGEASSYVQAQPINDQTLAVRPVNTSTDVLVIPNVTVPAGPAITTFAIGIAQSIATPLSALVCVDSAPPQNHLSACVIAGQAPGRANLRIAHLSPGAPAVDVCLKQNTDAAFPQKPLLDSLNVTSGIRYSQVTQYLSVPAGTYDIRVVAAGATTCNVGAVPDKNGVVVPAMVSATVAAIGVVNPTGDLPAFTLKPFVDNQSFYSSSAEVRIIHASPGTPPVDVGLGTGASFHPWFTDVAFGNTGSGDSISPNGYLSVPPFQSQTVTARLTGQNTDGLSLPNVSLAANQIATAYAIGESNSTTTPLALLLCLDNAPPQGLLAACIPPSR